MSSTYTSGTWRAPQGYKDLLNLLLLIIVTFGFYNLFWIYHMTEYTNADETTPKRNPTTQILLFLVPFYGLYWYWITAKKLSNMGKSVGIYKDYSVPATILPILSLGFIASLILQKQLNQILCINNGATINATGQGTCKNCKATFPNDATQCPNCGVEYKGNNLRKVFTYIIAVLYALVLLLLTISSAVRAYDNLFNENTATTTSNVQMPTKELESFSEAIAEETKIAKLKQDADGKWGLFYEDGSLNNLFTGLAQNEDTGEWFVVVNGYVNWDFMGVARNHESKTWYYCENGMPKYDATGQLQMEDGSTLYIENGKVIEGTFSTFDGNNTVSIKDGIETIS